jgi:hypothetical protein
LAHDKPTAAAAPPGAATEAVVPRPVSTAVRRRVARTVARLRQNTASH